MGTFGALPVLREEAEVDPPGKAGIGAEGPGRRPEATAAQREPGRRVVPLRVLDRRFADVGRHQARGAEPGRVGADDARPGADLEHALAFEAHLA